MKTMARCFYAHFPLSGGVWRVELGTMTDAERKQIVRELERRGWTYDPDDDTFCNGELRLQWKDALLLMSLPDLAEKRVGK
jgi:hypothetical protein